MALVETSSKDETGQFLDPKEGTHSKEPNASERKFKEFICGEEALRISPTEPYCFCHPIRRGHLNISQYYSMQQVLITSKLEYYWCKSVILSRCCKAFSSITASPMGFFVVACCIFRLVPHLKKNIQ